MTRKEVRAGLRSDPALLWLACWTVGALVGMEVLPSRHFDRMVAVLAPACLLVPAAARHLPRFKCGSEPISRLTILCTIAALPVAAAATASNVMAGYRSTAATGLTSFVGTVREVARNRHDRMAVLPGVPRNLLLYADHPNYTAPAEASTLWQAGRIDWLVASEPELARTRQEFAPYKVVANRPAKEGPSSSYWLLQRDASAARPQHSSQTVSSESQPNKPPAWAPRPEF